MAIAYRSAESKLRTSGPTSATVSRPSGVVDGDVLLTFIAIESDKTITTVPTGWTLIRSRSTTTLGSGGCKLHAYYKVASAEASSYTWGTSGGTDWAVVVLAYTGVDNVAPVDVSGDEQSDDANDTSVRAPSITTTVTNTLLITAHGANPTSYGPVDFSTPSSMSSRKQASPDGSGGLAAAAVAVFDQAVAAAGATGAKTSNLSGASDADARNVGISVALASSTGIQAITPTRLSSTITLRTPTSVTGGDAIVSPVRLGLTFTLRPAVISLPDFPTIIVELRNLAGTWFDISEYASEISIKRGRQRELERFKAGTCAVVLDNTDRRFDPTYAASPYAPNIKPMRRLRIRAIYEGVVYALFHGSVDTWDQSYRFPRGAVCVVRATDGFKVLNGKGLSAALDSAWAGDRSGARIGRILDLASWPAADRDLDEGQSTLQATALSGSALAALQKIEETEQGRLFMTADNVVRFVDRAGALDGAAVAAFGEATGELPYEDLTYDYGDFEIRNEVRRGRVGGVVQVVTDAASIAEYEFTRTDEVTDLLADTDAEMLDHAHWILGRHSDPDLRIASMVVDPGADRAALFPQVLGRELGERITVSRQPQEISPAITGDLHIEGISHRIKAREWATTWSLSPADTNPYWVLGESDLDEDTYLAF